MSIRHDLADAASTVDGVDVTPWYRQTAKAGHGWVSLQRRDRDDTGLGYMDRWAVTLVLHQDLRAAEEWIEEKADDLVAALEQQLIVTALVPSTLVMDNGNIPGLVIEGSRAH